MNQKTATPARITNQAVLVVTRDKNEIPVAAPAIYTEFTLDLSRDVKCSIMFWQMDRGLPFCRWWAVVQDNPCHMPPNAS